MIHCGLSREEVTKLRASGWLIMAAGVLIMFGTVLGLRLYQRHERAKEADRLFTAGQFEAAHAIYLELEDEEGAQACVEGYRASLYHEAEGLVRAGNFEAAEAILNALGPYGESDALLRDCDYLRANALAEKGETLAARELYLALGDYPGCAEQLAALTPALYDEAKEPWEEVLRRDANYWLAYIGLGNAYLNQNDYATALDYFYRTSRAGYNRAFKSFRIEFIRANFTWMLIIVLVVILALIVLSYVNKARKKKKAKGGSQ